MTGSVESEVVNDALDVDSRFGEVDEQAEFQAGAFEIVQALGHVHVVDDLGRFEFDENGTLDDQFGEIIADKDTVVVNLYGLLLSDGQAGLAEFVGEGVFIDLFEKAGAESVGDGVGAADDPFGDGIQESLVVRHWRRIVACVRWWE